MTIREIAKMAGVSNAMVSRYLNGGYVSAEKRKRIKEVIEETGYQPSARARSLRSGKANLVGVVVPKVSSESIGRIVSGVEQVLRNGGYQVLLANTENDHTLELDYLRLFENYPVDGLILVGTVITPRHKTFFRSSSVPVVIVGQPVEGQNCVFNDDEGAAHALAEALAEANPGARFAYVTVLEADKAAGLMRTEGFLRGLSDAGVDPENVVRVEAEFTSESGYEAVRDLIAGKSDVGVITCATDTIAAGAIRAVYERYGAMPGHDGAPVVAGFGDNRILQATTGGIPTVHFGYRTGGIRAAEMLLSLIDNDRTVPSQTMLSFRLVGI